MSLKDPRTEKNLEWWNERAALHRDTPLYQKHIQRLKEGGLSLLPLEVEELGDIKGLNVLHVQCHIGTDTLSLARLGATVTGVDFSKVAIEEARKLSSDLGIDATFEEGEMKDLQERYSEQFDMVFTSHGVISWQPDINEWANQIVGCLKTGGYLYLSDGHPLVWALADKEPIQGKYLRLEYPYLPQEEPDTFVASGSYADRELQTQSNETQEWSWGLGDIINALIGAGMRLEFLNEHPLGFCEVTPAFEEGADGHYRLPEPLDGRFPLSFTLRATK